MLVALLYWRLPDRSTGSGQWRCKSKPGETYTLITFSA